MHVSVGRSESVRGPLRGEVAPVESARVQTAKRLDATARRCVGPRPVLESLQDLGSPVGRSAREDDPLRARAFLLVLQDDAGSRQGSVCRQDDPAAGRESAPAPRSRPVGLLVPADRAEPGRRRRSSKSARARAALRLRGRRSVRCRSSARTGAARPFRNPGPARSQPR